MEDRITELECRVALQDETIEALNLRIHEQQRTIDELTEAVKRLHEALRSLRPSMIATAEEDAPPPHY